MVFVMICTIVLITSTVQNDSLYSTYQHFISFYIETIASLTCFDSNCCTPEPSKGTFGNTSVLGSVDS